MRNPSTVEGRSYSGNASLKTLPNSFTLKGVLSFFFFFYLLIHLLLTSERLPSFLWHSKCSDMYKNCTAEVKLTVLFGTK